MYICDRALGLGSVSGLPTSGVWKGCPVSHLHNIKTVETLRQVQLTVIEESSIASKVCRAKRRCVPLPALAVSSGAKASPEYGGRTL